MGQDGQAFFYPRPAIGTVLGNHGALPDLAVPIAFDPLQSRL
jgi:hypothetical protein